MKQAHWNQMARMLCGIFLACWMGAASAERIAEAGRIVLVVGDAKVSGKVVREGDVVAVGAKLSTGTDGYLYLKTIDNGFLILRPSSIATIEAYHVDKAKPAQSRFKFFLHQGVARSISGEAVGKARKNFRFNTPVAAIGVRGTDFSIYADVQETRVAVLSGGVIVSGFNASCRPQGNGPCEGSNSKELFAGSVGVLQVQKGENVPKLIEDKTLSPDMVVPPRHDEPGTAPAVSKTTTSDKTGEIHVHANRQETSTLDPVKEIPLQPVIWGRWQAISEELPATVDLEKLQQNGEYYVMVSNDHYLVWRNKENTVMTPASGGLRFMLQASQAHVESPYGKMDAQVSGGSLSFDFGRSLFSTQIRVTSEAQNYNLSANGSVTSDGIFRSHQTLPGNMDVRGFLAKGEQDMNASYVFQSKPNNGLEVSGVTIWGNPTSIATTPVAP